MRPSALVPIVVALGVGLAPFAGAVTCPVPTAIHPTVQSAVDDAACTEIELASQTYVESVTIGRTLSLSGVSSASSAIAGQVSVVGGTTVATLADLTVDGLHISVAGCFSEALDVADGAQVVGSNLVVVNGTGSGCPIFVDGFEDGTTDAWSHMVP